MTPRNQNPFLENPRTREKAAALVVTLLVLVLFAVLVTGFLAATRIESAASRNFAYQNIAEKMAYMGAERAIAQLNSFNLNSGTINNFISQPGRLTVNGIPSILSSASISPVTTTNVNLNQSQVIHPNKDTNLFTVPTVPNVVNIGGNNTATGRFAYWIDDDGSKINLNAAQINRPNFRPTSLRPFSAGTNLNLAPFTNGNLFSRLFQTNFFNSVTSDREDDPWGYFFTPMQAVAMSPSLSDRLFYIAAGPPNLTNALPFTVNNRLNLNGNLTATNLPQNTLLLRNFLSNAAGGNDLTRELDDIIGSKIDREEITNRFRSSFTQKYSRDLLRQIIININDLAFASQTNYSLPSAATGSSLTNSDGIPIQYFGNRNFVYLNEIAARVAFNPRTLTIAGAGNSRCEIQIWLKFELINPFSTSIGNQSQVAFKIDNFSATATYRSSNGTLGSATLSRTTVPALGPQSGATIVNQNVPPGIYLPESGISNSGNLTFGLEYQFFEGPRSFHIPPGATSITVSDVSFQISFVKLLQSADNNATIRDWAISQDFSGHGSTAGTLSFNGASIPQVTTSLKQSNGVTLNFQQPDSVIRDFNTGAVLGIAKNDPRVRRFANWSNPVVAWFPVAGNGNIPRLTFGRQNSVVDFNAPSGIEGIFPDRSTGEFASYFIQPTNTASSALKYESVSDLGRVHTGLQWRTLHMASQNTSEANAGHIPDWALLDAFYVGNDIPKLNINSIVYPAASTQAGTAIATNQSAAGLLRTVAVSSLLAGGTNLPQPTDWAPQNSRMTISGTNSFTNVALNISSMNFANTWSNRRTSLGSNAFPIGQYSMIGEVLEVSQVADFGITDAINEGRAASFIDAISLHSDVFSIYSLGQALDRQGRNVGEFMLRTQVQLDRTTGRFRPVFTEPVRVSNLPMP